MSYYMIRIGEGSRYIDEAKRGSFIAIGWNELPDLSKLKTLDKIEKAIDNSSYDYTTAKKAIQAGQIYRFISMQKGDQIKSELPVGLGKNKNLVVQNTRYSKLEKILGAKSIDDVFR